MKTIRLFRLFEIAVPPGKKSSAEKNKSTEKKPEEKQQQKSMFILKWRAILRWMDSYFASASLSAARLKQTCELVRVSECSIECTFEHSLLRVYSGC